MNVFMTIGWFLFINIRILYKKLCFNKINRLFDLDVVIKTKLFVD